LAAAGARPLALPGANPTTQPADGTSAPAAFGLVGRINPVNNDSAGDSNLITAVPPYDTASPRDAAGANGSGVQRLPTVTLPPPDYLMHPSALSRQYPSTSGDGQSSVRQPAAATRVDTIWATDQLDSRPSAPAVADEATDVPHIRLHTIRDGDSLFTLAERFLGDSGRYLEIYEANRDVLVSPEQLPIGGQLRIPRGGQKLTPAGTARRPGGSHSQGLPHDPQRLVPVTPRPPRD
jgi:hypothetical protein